MSPVGRRQPLLHNGREPASEKLEMRRRLPRLGLFNNVRRIRNIYSPNPFVRNDSIRLGISSDTDGRQREAFA